MSPPIGGRASERLVPPRSRSGCRQTMTRPPDVRRGGTVATSFRRRCRHRRVVVDRSRRSWLRSRSRAGRRRPRSPDMASARPARRRHEPAGPSRRPAGTDEAAMDARGVDRRGRRDQVVGEAGQRPDPGRPPAMARRPPPRSAAGAASWASLRPLRDVPRIGGRASPSPRRSGGRRRRADDRQCDPLALRSDRARR
jgi:hypothetical protein